MSRYHHNKVTHELEPIAGFGSRVATSVDGKKLTVHSSILNIDGYNYGEGDISTAVQMIAPIESSLVASKAYAVGDQFVYNGLLYKVTAAIASGGAIVIGTNCQVAPCVADQIQSLNNYLEFRDVLIGDIQIGSGGYVQIRPFKPTISGKNLIFASILNYGQTSAKDGGLIVDCNGEYLSGPANSSITTLSVRYFFI